MNDEQWEQLRRETEENFATVVIDKTEPIAGAIEEVVFYEGINSDDPGFWPAVRNRLENKLMSMEAGKRAADHMFSVFKTVLDVRDDEVKP